jgi:NSS family neurotransmitter:Na+ symporter
MSTEIARETDSLLKDETKSYTYKGSVDTALSYELPPSKPHSKPRRALSYVGKSILSVLGIKTKGNNNGEFTSSIGVMLSMMGCVIGTGNIWRFPRIMATHADEGGALVFIIVWCLFLFLWSIPICLIEYGIGRYTKKSVVESFHIMIGPSYRWMGAFITIVTLAIGSFYSVLLGYCAYYSVFFLFTELPSEFEVSNGHFQYLIDSPFPIICHIICIALACLALSRGVSTIEPVNRIIVPTLLFIVVFTFYWALTLPYAGMGIIHMFTPSWETFGDAQLWRDALTQNAWDTGAGGALFLTYATYMKREQGAVKLGSTTPIINNLVSLICGITIFCNVFSFEYLHASPINEIIDKLKNNGPYNTGITFIQMPILYGSIAGGRVLAILFFFCITLAGLSSLISILELCVHVLEDFGVKRLLATSIIFVLSLSLGLASALSNEVFTNQDAVWSQGLIVSGCMLIFLVIRFGIFKFRRDVVNNVS